MRHIISILIENEAGALSRVSGLFSARGYNIESLTVAPTDDLTLSRMTLVTRGSDEVIEQIIKQLNKLIIVTRGEKGAVAINGDEVIESDVQKNLKIIDLTGAGDLFAAGFLHGYINKLSTKECLEKGTRMSSKVIQQIGARL